ncbi:hypothetical protein BV22DRAFT_1133055 [Leucogyrophana mollusca]|uniref:Uncharacterized protein n=1 Tax=Leucogyrophana mollusca TaxID=85980 RepID=A0ACB8B5U9_9AGAM|nr:hypothetical protein BV22DRAFT_1133055 [Leucogyrophana mollusca]
MSSSAMMPDHDHLVSPSAVVTMCRYVTAPINEETTSDLIPNTDSIQYTKITNGLPPFGLRLWRRRFKLWDWCGTAQEGAGGRKEVPRGCTAAQDNAVRRRKAGSPRGSGQSSFDVGTAVARPRLAKLSSVIGFFANMLPIKTVVDETETFAEYLPKFKDPPIACLMNDEVTYDDVVTQGNPPFCSRSRLLQASVRARRQEHGDHITTGDEPP